MQNLIKETGLTNKEFAKYYGIPYNTVLQWSKGIRQAPKYLIKLIRENRELKTNGVQLNISTGRKFNIIQKEVGMFTLKMMYEEGKDDESYKNDIEHWSEMKKEIITFKVQEIL